MVEALALVPEGNRVRGTDGRNAGKGKLSWSVLRTLVISEIRHKSKIYLHVVYRLTRSDIRVILSLVSTVSIEKGIR